VTELSLDGDKISEGNKIKDVVTCDNDCLCIFVAVVLSSWSHSLSSLSFSLSTNLSN